MEDVMCRANGLDGERCKRYRRAGKETCTWHDPEAVEARAQALEEQAARIRETAAVRAS